jgi:hypothetical protein
MSKILFQVRVRGESLATFQLGQVWQSSIGQALMAGLCTSPQAFDTMEVLGIEIHH